VNVTTTTEVKATQDQVEAFVERVVGDLAGTMAAVLGALGDRLGLFGAMPPDGATSSELAGATGLDERYVREWASGMSAAGYLAYDAGSGRFRLPAAHAAVLADESGPAFLGGALGTTLGMLAMAGPVESAFRNGGGVAAEAFGERFWIDVERFTGPDFEHRLIPEWIPAEPGLADRLAAGATVADIGCGSGRAIIKMAEAFPSSVFHGYDIVDVNVVRARASAAAAGLGERVSFERLDAIDGLPGSYDVITLFAVVHDAGDPPGLLRAARAALRPDGVCLVQEITSGERPEDNRGPVATVLYGFSLLHCMTQALAVGGQALGTCGLPESRLRTLAFEAGFSSVQRLVDGPLDTLYALRP
jgi:2-polyprenyl-3-methyl-5-hydroxy-6-metoxy-1,4-benzoquinol methylase